MEKIDEILEKYPHIWKSKSAFMSYLRGGIRRSCWMKHPVKLEFIKNNRQRIPNPNTKGKAAEVWGGECNVCKNLFVQSQLAVDHIREFSATLKEIKDIQSFVELISLVTEEDLQFVCKDCHDTISYSQKHNCSFEEARAEKEAKRLVDKKVDKQFLIDHNVKAENIGSTQAVRRKQIVEILLELNKLKEKQIE